MPKRLLLAGLTGFYYGRSAADPKRRPNLFASFALQEAEGSRTLEKIRDCKAAEIPSWLDELMQRHINDEVRHARIFTKAVEWEGCQIDKDCQAAQSAMDSVGEGSFKRFHKTENLAEVPLTNLLAGILVAEEAGVRGFRCVLQVLPESMVNTRVAIASVLQDEKRHVQYLRDALYRLGGTEIAEQFRRDIEDRIFNDLGKIFEYLTKPSTDRPVIVKTGVNSDVALV